MIQVSINNIQQKLAVGSTIAEALDTLGYADQTMLGVALNQVFIPKDQWANTLLNNNDQLEVLNPVSGG